MHREWLAPLCSEQSCPINAHNVTIGEHLVCELRSLLPHLSGEEEGLPHVLGHACTIRFTHEGHNYWKCFILESSGFKELNGSVYSSGRLACSLRFNANDAPLSNFLFPNRSSAGEICFGGFNCKISEGNNQRHSTEEYTAERIHPC